jgi:hypothetical protein
LQVRVQAGGCVREFDRASSPNAGNDQAWCCSVSTCLIDDLESRGLGLKLVVADFRKQNHGLGLHDVLLSLSSGPVALPRQLCRRSRRVWSDDAPAHHRWHQSRGRFFRAA